MSKVKTISVDPHNLEQEWTDQPGAMHWCLIRWAEATQEKREAEAELEKVTAEQGEVCRAKAGEKATETAVKRLILATKPYQQALARRDNTAHEVRLIEAERTALEHKKAALENLTRLRLADWYSEPKYRANAVREEDDVEQRQGLQDRKPRKKPERIK